MAKRLPPDRLAPPAPALDLPARPEARAVDLVEDVEDIQDESDDVDESDDDILDTALERFKLVCDAESEQRAQELDDLKFARARREDQWDPSILQMRAGGAVGNTVAPAKPCLVIDKIGPALRQILNDATRARLAQQVKAKGNGANSDGAEMRQGMIRSIEQDSNGQFARMWALRRAAICGRGYYRITTDYANDGDFDLDLRIESILNQGSVYLDPHHTDPSGADAEWAFLTEDLTHAEYKRLYPESDVADRISGEFQSDTDLPPDWITKEHVRIAEYWCVKHRERTLVYDPSLPTDRNNRAFLDELKKLIPGFQPGPQTRTRKVDQRVVYRHVINGLEVLKTEQWDGRYIPIVQVIGEMHVVDGKTSYKGVVFAAKDPQRSYNYFRSDQVSRVALGGTAPYLIDPVVHFRASYQGVWDKSAGKMLPYLPVAVQDESGQRIPSPTRNFAEPEIQGVTLAVREADNDIKAATGVFDPSLGNLSSTERSGKAIQALQQQGQTSSSHFLENLATISMPHEGRILLDMLPHVYDRPGRIVRLLGEDEGDEKNALIGVPFVPGPDGQPVPVPPGAMLPPGMPQPKVYDLSQGEYRVAVTVGRSFATQKEQNLDVMNSWVEASKGAAFPWVADIMAEQLDGNIAKRVAKRMKMMNPQLAQGEDEQEIPPQAQAMMAQAQQQMQQMQAAMQEMKAKLDADAVRAQADLARTKMEIESKERIAHAQIEADLAKTKLLTTSKEGLSILEMQEARVSRVLDVDREDETRERDEAMESEREARTRQDKDADHRRKVEAADRQAVGKAALAKFQAGLDAQVTAREAEAPEAAPAAQPFTSPTDASVGVSAEPIDPRGIA